MGPEAVLAIWRLLPTKSSSFQLKTLFSERFLSCFFVCRAGEAEGRCFPAGMRKGAGGVAAPLLADWRSCQRARDRIFHVSGKGEINLGAIRPKRSGWGTARAAQRRLRAQLGAGAQLKSQSGAVGHRQVLLLPGAALLPILHQSHSIPGTACPTQAEHVWAATAPKPLHKKPTLSTSAAGGQQSKLVSAFIALI